MSVGRPSEDTQAVLLLCSRLGSRSPDLQPLSRSEFNGVALSLHGAGLRPADLFQKCAGDPETGLDLSGISRERVCALLDRGTALGLAVESWSSRGIWVVSRSDDAYPTRLKKRLGRAAPPLLYGSGSPQLLDEGGLAIVGSRAIDAQTEDFTLGMGARCGSERIQVISGGARGVDSLAMGGALEAGGSVVGVLADSLARAVVTGPNRTALREGVMTLVSANDPSAPFSVGFAMDRNKFIYALSDWALVVSSAKESGGTWAGAVENLRRAWVPLFVRDAEDVPEGNKALLRKGAVPFPVAPGGMSGSLRDWLEEHTPQNTDAQDLAPVEPKTGGYEQMELVTDRAADRPALPKRPVAIAQSIPVQQPKPSTASRAAGLLPLLANVFTRADAAALLPEATPSQLRAVFDHLKGAGLIAWNGGGAKASWRKLGSG